MDDYTICNEGYYQPGSGTGLHTHIRFIGNGILEGHRTGRGTGDSRTGRVYTGDGWSDSPRQLVYYG